MKISEILREANSNKKRSLSESRIDDQSTDSDSWESDGGRPDMTPDDSSSDTYDNVVNKKTEPNNAYDKEGFNKQGVNRWGATREEVEDYEITGDLETDNKIWMEMGDMITLEDSASDFSDVYNLDKLIDAIQKYCDAEQTRTIIDRLDNMNYYYAYRHIIYALLVHLIDLTNDNNIWKEIIEYSITDILYVPGSLLKNENFAISIIDAAVSSAESIDKHYIRSGALENWNNNPVELMKDWAKQSPLGPKAKKHLNNCVRRELFNIY